jgi:hypothetical protein
MEPLSLKKYSLFELKWRQKSLDYAAGFLNLLQSLFSVTFIPRLFLIFYTAGHIQTFASLSLFSSEGDCYDFHVISSVPGSTAQEIPSKSIKPAIVVAMSSLVRLNFPDNVLQNRPQKFPLRQIVGAAGNPRPHQHFPAVGRTILATNEMSLLCWNIQANGSCHRPDHP